MQIFVSGSDNPKKVTSRVRKICYEVGKEIAERGHVLLTGGLGGVMEFTAKGAFENRGTVVGIVPSEKKEEANKYCTTIIPSGIGFARDFILCNAADGLILITGGEGAHVEAIVCATQRKPIVSFPETGWKAKELANKVLSPGSKPIRPVKTAREALNYLEKEANTAPQS